MTKADLVASLAESSGLEKNKCERFIDSFTEVIVKAVAEGEKVRLVGFGTFLSRERASRVGRSPKDGKEIKIEASVTPAFKPGKLFKEALNRKKIA
ncbi:MAG: HU family DNA-binding protein [Oscillospiraceae bacterium]|nr:HU family DNA-binding protein [Oscillospiraceae bacterium]